MNGLVDDPLPSPYLHELTELRSRSGRRRSTGGHRVHRVEFRRFGGMPDLERTRRAMRVAAADGSSCSQTRITSQPRCRSRSLVFESRSMLARIFARQNCSLAFGHVPCSGQPCQKQPSTKTATLARRNTTSARRGESSSGLASTEYRSPIACNNFRMRSSAGVSRCGVDCMRFRAVSEDASGRDISTRLRSDCLAFGRAPCAFMQSSRPAHVVRQRVVELGRP